MSEKSRSLGLCRLTKMLLPVLPVFFFIASFPSDEATAVSPREILF